MRLSVSLLVPFSLALLAHITATPLSDSRECAENVCTGNFLEGVALRFSCCFRLVHHPIYFAYISLTRARFARNTTATPTQLSSSDSGSDEAPSKLSPAKSDPTLINLVVTSPVLPPFSPHYTAAIDTALSSKATFSLSSTSQVSRLRERAGRLMHKDVKPQPSFTMWLSKGGSRRTKLRDSMTLKQVLDLSREMEGDDEDEDEDEDERDGDGEFVSLTQQ